MPTQIKVFPAILVSVTGDALNNNNNKPQAQAVLEGGGDYFFHLKNENRHVYKTALQKAKGTPFLPTQKSRTPATDASTSCRKKSIHSSTKRPHLFQTASV